MAWTDVSAGQIMTATKFNELASYAVPITAEKTSGTARINNTISADPELVVVLPANRTYDIDLLMRISSAANAAGDFQYRWAWTGTADVTVYNMGVHNAIASGSQSDLESISYAVDSSTPSSATPLGASTTTTSSLAKARVVTGGSSVTLTLEWAQSSTNANATTLDTGSTLTARRRA